MIKWIKALFSEDSDVSMVRFMALLSLLLGCFLAIIGRDATIVSVFVGGAFGAKIIQKQIEVNAPKD